MHFENPIFIQLWLDSATTQNVVLNQYYFQEKKHRSGVFILLLRFSKYHYRIFNYSV